MAATTKWLYASNTFMILASRSGKRFYKFMFSFMAALHAEYATPDIQAIYDEIKPTFDNYKKAFIDWQSQQGVSKGKTFTKDELFEILHNEKMPDWHRRISVLHPPKSEPYITIFPRGITPFGEDALEARLLYFQDVIKNALLYSDLLTITGEMTLFRADIESARTTQKESGSGVKTFSADLKIKGEIMATDTYGALADLMKFHKAKPENIKRYFLLSLLHYYKKDNGEPEDLYELEFANSETKEAGFPFLLTDRLMLYNSGNTTLRVWFVAAIGDAMNTYFDMNADDEKDFLVSDYANVNDRFMMIKNLSETEAGSVEIEKV
jgi:hypothetical protein